MRNVNDATKLKAARKLSIAKGYKEVEAGIRNINENVPFTIPSVIPNTWDELNESERISLSKNFSNNIKYGNLRGIHFTKTPKGKPQRYIKIAKELRLRDVFCIDNKGHIDSREKFEEIFTSIKNEVVVICNSKFINSSKDKVKVNVHGIVDKEIIFEDIYEKNLGSADMTPISYYNKEFPSIYSVWFGFELVWRNLNKLHSKIKKDDKILFIATNPQMVARLTDSKWGEQGAKYEYVEYIQEAFKHFLKNNLKEIPYSYCIYSIDKRNLDSWMKKLTKRLKEDEV